MSAVGALRRVNFPRSPAGLCPPRVPARWMQRAAECGSRLLGGKGTAKEIVIRDKVRQLTRSVRHEFWFNVDKDGVVRGEIEMTYDSRLVVDCLPSQWASCHSTPRWAVRSRILIQTGRFRWWEHLQTAGLRKSRLREGSGAHWVTIRADPGVSAGIGAGNGRRVCLAIAPERPGSCRSQ